MLYPGLEELEKDLDEWLIYYSDLRARQGKRYQGRTHLQFSWDKSWTTERGLWGEGRRGAIIHT